MNHLLACGRYRVDLSRPRLMGIVNLTDDSFSGDGHCGDRQSAVEHALRLIEEGADFLDLGAESSRPGAVPVTAAQQIDRLLPVVGELRDCGVPLSVDTSSPEVMRESIAAGADMINDIGALMAPDALAVVAPSTVAVCLMHMRGSPDSMQRAPAYDDVVAEVGGFLRARVQACIEAGIDAARLVVDPGFGFGKTLAHNLALLRRLDELAVAPAPVLVGVSRKSLVGELTGRNPAGRQAGSVTAALLAAMRGAKVLRVHDVAAMRDALAVWRAVEGGN